MMQVQHESYTCIMFHPYKLPEYYKDIRADDRWPQAPNSEKEFDTAYPAGQA